MQLKRLYKLMASPSLAKREARGGGRLDLGKCRVPCRLILAAVLSISFLLASVAQADGLPGDEDPAFLVAVETWLDGNDVDSLPALASLARSGNVAARLLLSRIEVTDLAMGDYVAGLTRAERHDLFRPKAGEGRFRATWLKTESDVGNPFAADLLASQGTEIDIEAVETLMALGEPEAADHLIRKVAVDGTQSERKRLLRLLAPDSENAPYVRAFYDNTQGTTTGRTALQYMMAELDGLEPASVMLGDGAEIDAAAMFVDFGYQAGSRPLTYGDGNSYFERIARWVMRAPAATALAKLCRRACTDKETPDCANLSFGLIGGYYEVIRFDSPLEAVIDQSRFVKSDRAVGMAIRRILTAHTEADVPVFSDQELRRRSACLADAVEALR